MDDISNRIKKLRENMKEVGIDYCLIPTSDCHDSEYVSDYFKVREYFSGFTGSAGDLVIGIDDAYLFTDGRYFLQAESELDGTEIELMKMGEPGVLQMSELILEKVVEGKTLGFDGRVVSFNSVKFVVEKLSQCGATVDDSFNPAAEIPGRDNMNFKNISILEEKYTGEDAVSKIERIYEYMRECGADTHLVTTLDDIAWILNLRGQDIPCNPVFFSYLLFNEEGIYLYVNSDSLNDLSKEYLEKLKISVIDYAEFYEDIGQRVKKCTLQGVLLDLNRVSYGLYAKISESCRIINKTNPSTIFKSVKNEVEIENIRKANVIDGIAMVRFNMWLDRSIESGTYLDEILVRDKLLEFREMNSEFKGSSFDTICAYGSNGAIVHYETQNDSNREIVQGSFLLIDSGGQYKLGTTDVTRTYAIGMTGDILNKDYTLVLKAMLKLGKSIFREGTKGSSLDMIARDILWKNGKDFRHGTGHGIGCYLNVHEGPTRISINTAGKDSDCVFKPGMLSSDEPGIYVAGAYGIRIENDIICKKVFENEYGTFLGFEFVTYVPIDTSCIDMDMMNAEDIEAVNEYHEMVYEKLAPYLNSEERNYLKGKCKRL